MRQSFTIKNGATTLVSASNKVLKVNEVLFNLEGWDDNSNFTIETAEKLVGHGSYLISHRVGERSLTITLNALDNHYTLRRSFESIAYSNTPTLLTLELSYYSNDTTTTASRTETLQGYISSLPPFDSTQKWGNVILSILCLNPIKTIS